MLAIVNPFAVRIHNILVHSRGLGYATSKKPRFFASAFTLRDNCRLSIIFNYVFVSTTSVESLKLIPLLLKPFERLRKCGTQLVDTLYRIMESND